MLFLHTWCGKDPDSQNTFTAKEPVTESVSYNDTANQLIANVQIHHCICKTMIVITCIISL